MQEIGAPDEALVNAAEIHNMRDADQGAAEFMWTKGYQSIWTMPNVSAMGTDGKIAGSCPGRLRHSACFTNSIMNSMNALGARERVKMGLLASDSFKMLPKPTKSGQPTGGVLQGFLRKNPASR